MIVSKQQLHQLIKNKLHHAGLNEVHADTVADVLVHADAKGIHSHGAVRVEYYAERISKGGQILHLTLLILKQGLVALYLTVIMVLGMLQLKMQWSVLSKWHKIRVLLLWESGE